MPLSLRQNSIMINFWMCEKTRLKPTENVTSESIFHVDVVFLKLYEKKNSLIVTHLRWAYEEKQKH